MNATHCSALLLAGLLLAAGCNNNDTLATGGGRDPSGFVLRPSGATIDLAQTGRTEVFRVDGGGAPYTWTVSDPALGTVPTTGERIVTYTATNRPGVNVLRVTDARGNTVSASIVQE